MKIGCPREVKNKEYRVGLMPSIVNELVRLGHTVFIEAEAGIGSGFSDQEYRDAGAQIITDAANIFYESEMIVKVKEPQKSEIALLKKIKYYSPIYI